ncbi:MAG TPA: hypothetical protein VEQ17_03535 [Steroidobacteraceae bacterium]|nr:hypothetical protein [Steroidobacteraceae bacterium]
MSEVSIVPVRSASELKRFIRLPAILYADDPNFVPQLEMERRDALTPRNPYFEHAEAQFFLAVRDGRDVGRISAQIDQLVKDPSLGHFGLIVAENDPQVFTKLLHAAESWLRERGKSRVLGPFNLCINEEMGLLIDGFDTPPMIFMSHDPRYCALQLEQHGYRKAKDVLAYLYDAHQDVPPAARRLIQRHVPKGLTVRHIDMKNFMKEFDMVIDIFNDAWSENWEFVPFTPAELKHMAKGLKPLLRSELTAVVELHGRPIGFSIALPNLNEAIRDFGGKLLPFNWLKLLLRLKRGTTTARVALLGIRRNLDVGLLSGLLPYLLIDEMRREAPKRLRNVELSWILEDNRPMRRVAESLGATAYKTYRMYEKPLS